MDAGAKDADDERAVSLLADAAPCIAPPDAGQLDATSPSRAASCKDLCAWAATCHLLTLVRMAGGRRQAHTISYDHFPGLATRVCTSFSPRLHVLLIDG
jgi:hypothetical protein